MVLKFLTLPKMGPKYVERFEMCCWRTMEKISLTKGVRNEETLHIGQEDRITLNTIIRRKADWTGHILRRNCLLKPLL